MGHLGTLIYSVKESSVTAVTLTGELSGEVDIGVRGI